MTQFLRQTSYCEGDGRFVGNQQIFCSLDTIGKPGTHTRYLRFWKKRRILYFLGGSDMVENNSWKELTGFTTKISRGKWHLVFRNTWNTTIQKGNSFKICLWTVNAVCVTRSWACIEEKEMYVLAASKENIIYHQGNMLNHTAGQMELELDILESD